MQAYYSLTILIICKKNKNIININIVSIFITLTEINNETHYVAKKKKKKKIYQRKNPKKTQSRDLHSQCKSAGVAKQRLYDHGYGTVIKFVSFVVFFVVYKVYLM